MSFNNSQSGPKQGVLFGLSGLGLLVIGLLCAGLTMAAVAVGLLVTADNDAAPAPTTPTPQPTSTGISEPTETHLPPTDTHTPTPQPLDPTSTPLGEATSTPQQEATSTPMPPTQAPTATSVPPTQAPTSTPLPPTQTSTPAPAAPTVTSPPPSSGVKATFLSDARQTKDDLMTIKIWFDRLAGGESIACSTVYGHGIHRPSSTAPAQSPSLAPTWNEYQAAIADGQKCLQWLVDFCDSGGGTIDQGTFWSRRDLSSSALSRCEHVVQELQ